MSAKGGGIIKINALSSLTLDGTISADGDQSNKKLTGGGSGGSVWLTTKYLSGNGESKVLGGNGNASGGGGGGGRISVTFRNSSFSGAFKAFGGSSRLVKSLNK